MTGSKGDALRALVNQHLCGTILVRIGDIYRFIKWPPGGFDWRGRHVTQVNNKANITL